MTIPFTASDFIFAALLALFLTWLFKLLLRMFKLVVNRSTEFDYSPHDQESVLEKCYLLFPRESFRFENEIFQRGMQVRISTYRNKVLEGQFVGMNDDNMVCIMTKYRVVAQELDMIENIVEL